MFKELMVKNFPNLMSYPTRDPRNSDNTKQDQQPQHAKHIIFTELNIKDENKLPKAIRGKKLT